MDTVARFGGDEFVLMISELDADKTEPTVQVGVIAEKIFSALSQPFVLNTSSEREPETTIEHRCSASVGVALFVDVYKRHAVVWRVGVGVDHLHADVYKRQALADCSRILSNFYLQKYDQFAAGICTQAGATYFRYADDQMILLNDPGKIDNLLLLLTRNLDRYGLRVNQKKVKLWRTPELIEHRCREIQAIFANKGDNQDPLLVRKFVDAYLTLTPEKLADTWNGGMPLLNRLLWARLDSLPRSLFNKMMVRLTAERFLLQVDAQKMKRISKLNALRTSPIDLNNRKMCIRDRL